MIEEYCVPILFNEHERREYYIWGKKRQKLYRITLIPTLLIFALVCLIVLIGQFVLLGVISENAIIYWALHNMLLRNAMFASMVEIHILVVGVVCALINETIFFIFKCIHKQPKNEKYIELMIDPRTLRVNLVIREYKTVIYEETMSVKELLNSVHKRDNCIEIYGNIYNIGENTREYIYNDKSRDIFLNTPKWKTKKVSIREAEQLAEVLDGIILGEKALRQAEEWQQYHGDVE